MRIGDILFLPFAWLMSLLWSSKDQGSDPRYQAWLDRYGYEAQYRAYLEAHNGSNEGFVYKDIGDMPKDWRP
jgi:hypothetical protein